MSTPADKPIYPCPNCSHPLLGAPVPFELDAAFDKYTCSACGADLVIMRGAPADFVTRGVRCAVTPWWRGGPGMELVTVWLQWIAAYLVVSLLLEWAR